MPIEIVADVGGATSNSFETQDEANYYFTRRVPLDPPWPTSGDTAAVALIMATRLLMLHSVPRRILIRSGTRAPYYYITRGWTGTVATSTQALPSPRTGMYDWLGRAIASNVVPQLLKDAQSELAGQLLIADRTLDSDIITQGIKRVKAGSVEVEFNAAGEIFEKVLPDAVINLIPPSWWTDEEIESTVGSILPKTIGKIV